MLKLGIFLQKMGYIEFASIVVVLMAKDTKKTQPL